MEIKFSVDELRVVGALNASIEQALEVAEDADDFEVILLEDVSGWVIELRETKGDKDARSHEPMLQDMVTITVLSARDAGLRSAALRSVMLDAIVAAVTCEFEGN